MQGVIMNQCQRYNVCSSPVCPLLDNSNVVWYPNEEVCMAQQHNKIRFVYMQRKIQKKTRDLDSYYTFDMLNRKCIVGKGMTGINPDKDKEPQIAIWFKRHKENTRQYACTINPMLNKDHSTGTLSDKMA